MSGEFEYHSDRLAASHFLRDKIPAQMLRELRELEFVFPPYRHTGWPGEGHPALTDWVETLVWARDKMNLGALAVRLVMADSVASLGSPPDRRDLTSEQVEDILSAYHRIISPLAILAQPEAKGVVGRGGGDGELLSFHAKVAWPLSWRWDSEDNLDENGVEWGANCRRDKLQELTEEAERLVMGQRYNEHYVSGRASQWKSMWEAVLGSFLW